MKFSLRNPISKFGLKTRKVFEMGLRIYSTATRSHVNFLSESESIMVFEVYSIVRPGAFYSDIIGYCSDLKT